MKGHHVVYHFIASCVSLNDFVTLHIEENSSALMNTHWWIMFKVVSYCWWNVSVFDCVISDKSLSLRYLKTQEAPKLYARKTYPLN